MRSRRAAAALLAALGVVGALALSHNEPGVEATASRALAFPSSALTAPKPAAPTWFAHRLLVYTNDALTPSQVRAVRAATRAPAAAVSLYEQYVASGKSSYPDIPVLTMVTDPRDYAAAVGDPSLAKALAGGAVLAATEARLRRLGVGGSLHLSDGRRVRVTAVVDDHVLGGNEMSLPVAISGRRGARADYLLVGDDGDGARTERAVRGALRGEKVRVTTKTGNGYLSAADRVLTQLQVKALFGEFAMRRTGATTFVQDPAWVDRYLVNRRITQLGPVTCHRRVVPALTAAMTEITRRDLGSTVHTADFQYEGGCWNPNIIPGSQGTISRHSWGITIDVNVDTNSFGDRPRQDPRLVSILAAHGFTWGGLWLTPDGMHFEYADPSAR